MREDVEKFRKEAQEIVEWIASYMENIRNYPVKSQVKPGDILSKLPKLPPQKSESFEKVFRDFENIIMPGVTHWQHPAFFAYFQGNTSAPSILADMLIAGLGLQCMIWDTSPAAAELEEQMMKWLCTSCGLPENWEGVIQDTASTATLCSILTAREQINNFKSNLVGVTQANKKLRAYASMETHSSAEKGVKIAGIGSENCIKIPVDKNFAMDAEALEHAIEQDRQSGFTPLWVVATIGTTGSTAIDPVRKIGEICKRHHLWLHVDAAYAGTAALLPEKRWIMDGVEFADSYVFNPHKWMMVGFDCCAYFVRDAKALTRTFEILPEYLKTSQPSAVKNYRDWGIQLGRRFRALKLWFVMRMYGIEGIQAKLRKDLQLTDYFLAELKKNPEIEIIAPVPLNLVCFRFHPKHLSDPSSIDEFNAEWLSRANASGKVYLSHTKLNGKYVIRVAIGQTNVEKEDVSRLLELIRDSSARV